MYKFADYLSLSRETKSLVTRYWLACLKDHLGVSSAYGIKKQLAHDKKDLEQGWINNSSRFFNHKEGGQIIARKSVLENIDKQTDYRFNSMAIFCHPLWQLIDKPNPSPHTINQVLAELPKPMTDMLFEEDPQGNLIRRKTIHNKSQFKLLKRTDIHVLTYLIAICLESARNNLQTKREHKDQREQNTDQLIALHYLLKITCTTSFSAIGEDFYYYMNEQFWPLTMKHDFEYFTTSWPCKKHNGQVIDVPMRLFTEDTTEIQDTLTLYNELSQQAIEIGIIEDSVKGKTDFYNSLRHSQLQATTDLLYQTEHYPKSLKQLASKAFLS
ncbi:MAG: hypothetical protein HRU08_08025 [Oleispira sp.]|nr:hypothetical protein [Oleispira sp.]